jgi:DNA-directed RNA polymerase subunit N
LKNGERKMMIPVRCFTCGKAIGDKWEEFVRRTRQGEEPKRVLDELGVTRYCCRRMLLTQVDLLEDIMIFTPGQEES